MLRSRTYAIGLTPILGVLGYLVIRSAWAASRLMSDPTAFIWGVALLIGVVLAALIKFREMWIVRLVTSFILVTFMTLCIFLMSIFEFRVLYLVFIVGVWGGVLGIAILRDFTREWKTRGQDGMPIYRFRASFRSKALMLAVFMWGTLLISSPYYTVAPRSFYVTDQQAKQVDLVVYWGGQMQMNETLVDICKDANATLSFNMPETFFQPGNAYGNYCAQVVKYANAQGVKIEIWPLFDARVSQYMGYSGTQYLPTLYDEFQAWVQDNNLTVDYILWDIEEGPPTQNYTGWAKDIPGLNSTGAWGLNMQNLRNRSATWDQTLFVWDTIAKRARADGHIPRATINPLPMDILTGSNNEQKYNGMPSFDIRADYDYISMMLYRGCEGGGNSTPESVYTGVKALSATQTPGGSVGVCLGCLNYLPYPTIASVQNDVRLAIAAGATSVRLFQGQSWTDGGNFPGHGFTGLRELLLAVRQGGAASFVPSPSYEIGSSASIIQDVFYDFVYV